MDFDGFQKTLPMDFYSRKHAEKFTLNDLLNDDAEEMLLCQRYTLRL